MATYLQGVTDYIPDYQPFQPDYNFYNNVLQAKQTQYDTNWKALNNVYSTLYNANLLGAGTENTSVYDMNQNFTSGIGNISARIPTILLIVAVVFLFGALILLMRNAKSMGIGGGGSL